MRTMNGFSVNVERKDLIAKLKENRKEHAEEYEHAKTGYCLKKEELIKVAFRDVKKDAWGTSLGEIKQLRRPVSQDDVYAEVLGMLEMSVDDTLQLSSDQHRAWVLNKWSEIENFNVSNSAYIAMSKAKVIGR